jgi:Cof subfamily protein (haloacid dehalogenase superfamily)
MTEQAGLGGYRLLVLDVDGTLTMPDGEISRRVKAALHEAMAAGVLVTLATGRSFALARRYAEALALRLPVIVHSGAAIRDSATGEVLYETPVPQPATSEVVRLAAAFGLQPILFRTGNHDENVLAGPPELDNPASDWYLGNKREALIRLPVEQLAASEAPLNIAVPAPPERGMELLHAARDVSGCRLFLTRFQHRPWAIVEALAPESSKAAAMRHLASLIEVRADQVIAVGDQPNDLEMIEAAGLGVAMGNAAEIVKERAGVVAPSNEEDGVAWVIERFILQGDHSGRRLGDYCRPGSASG